MHVLSQKLHRQLVAGHVYYNVSGVAAVSCACGTTWKQRLNRNRTLLCKRGLWNLRKFNWPFRGSMFANEELFKLAAFISSSVVRRSFIHSLIHSLVTIAALCSPVRLNERSHLTKTTTQNSVLATVKVSILSCGLFSQTWQKFPKATENSLSLSQRGPPHPHDQRIMRKISIAFF